MRFRRHGCGATVDAAAKPWQIGVFADAAGPELANPIVR
jgi:hypothetical protein